MFYNIFSKKKRKVREKQGPAGIFYRCVLRVCDSIRCKKKKRPREMLNRIKKKGRKVKAMRLRWYL